MPVDYTIKSPNGPVVLTVDDHVDAQGIVEAYEAFLADPAFKRGMDLLADLRTARLHGGPEAVRHLIARQAASRSRRGEGYRVALVAAHSHQQALAQLFATFSRSEPFTVNVFETPLDALAWLAEGAT